MGKNDATVAAREGALLAAVSYSLEARDAGKAPSDEEDQGAIIKSMTGIKTFSGAQYGGYGYAATYQGTLVIGFSGTDFTSIDDVLADVLSLASTSVDLGGTEYSAGLGFVQQYNELKGEGLNVVIDSVGAGPPVRVAGHSLGGALANLCGVELA